MPAPVDKNAYKRIGRTEAWATYVKQMQGLGHRIKLGVRSDTSAIKAIEDRWERDNPRISRIIGRKGRAS